MFETFLVSVRRDTAAAPMRTTAQGASSPPDMLSQQPTASTTPGQVGTVVMSKKDEKCDPQTYGKWFWENTIRTLKMWASRSSG